MGNRASRTAQTDTDGGIDVEPAKTYHLPPGIVDLIVGWQGEMMPIQQRINDTINAARLTLGVPDGWMLRPDGVFVEPQETKE